jgi:hypothetical protein
MDRGSVMASPRDFDWTHGHVQRETGTDSPHIERSLIIRMPGRDLDIRFQLPAHIYQRLSEAEREEARLYCEDLFGKMYFVARVAKVMRPEQVCIEETLRTYVDLLYRAFVKLQLSAGNKKWLVPASMQTRVLEER